MTGALRRRISTLALGSLLASLSIAAVGCPDPLAGKEKPTPSPTAASKADTRYMKVRKLLGEDPDSPARAKQLYGLVAPLCTSAEERAEFLEVAKWSVSYSSTEYYLPARLAGDTLEHVATSCMRNHPEGAFDLLTKARAALPKMHRISVIEARLRAAHGDLEGAEAAATVAMKAGSIHALALTANIQARRARAAAPGYREGMFDAAIETVSAEPTTEWAPIDLTAVLSTKARLLSERALWEAPEAASRTRLEAAGLHQRLSGGPFIRAVRRRALDVLCFEAIVAGRDLYGACDRLAKTGDLGAAKASGMKTLPEGQFELERLARIEAWRADVDAMPKGQAVLLVVRGDELELLEWIRAASRALAYIAAKEPRWIVVDRTKGERAGRLVERLLELSGVKGALRIDAKDTFAMPCITAQLADRKLPKGCPLPEAAVTALRKARPYAFSVLVGRDLDGEIDDLRLYDLRTVLLSVRQSRMEKGVDAWLKSLSDVGLLTRPEGFGALRAP